MSADSSNSEDQGPLDRQRRIDAVVDNCMQRWDAGQPIDGPALLAQHPDLMPELAERLRAMHLILDAGRSLDETQAVALRAGLQSQDPLRDAIPGYEILRPLSRGGQGAVYLALQTGTRRKVAIKIMREGPFASHKDKVRFDREIRILGALNHPGIATIHDSGVTAHGHYYTMDYISGQPLDHYVTDHQLGVEAVLALFLGVCEAVNAAHLKGVVHRDLKPGNILVDESGKPTVLDFGLARVATADFTDETHPQVMTATGQFVGSMPWSAPEQVEGRSGKIDTRTDVYALGVILYQLLAGRFPYPVVGSPHEVVHNILHVDPQRPSSGRRGINDEVEMIVLKALAKERERRYQVAGELARDIRRYLAGEPIEAKRDSVWYLTRKTLGRHRVKVGVAAVFAVALPVAALIGQAISRPPTSDITQQVDVGPNPIRHTYERDRIRNIRRGVPPEVFERPKPSEVDYGATLYRSLNQAPVRYCHILKGTEKHPPDLEIAELLYDTLFVRRFDGILEDNPAVIEGAFQCDGKTGILRIRPDALWQDGRPLTAEDVIFSWDVYRRLRPGEEFNIESMEVRGETLVVHYREARSEPQRELNFPIIPKHVYGAADLSAGPEALAQELTTIAGDPLIGNGPYRLVARSPRIVLERWDGYPGQPPCFKRIDFRVEPDAAGQFQLFLDGALDVITLSAGQYVAQRANRDFPGYVVDCSRSAYSFVMWNMAKRPELFGDPQVRRALAHAFHLTGAMDRAGLDPDDQVVGIFPEQSWVGEMAAEQYRYNPELAASLLDTAGWKLQDGVRVRTDDLDNPVPFRFTIAFRSAQVNQTMMEALADDLARVGIQVSLLPCTAADWLLGLERAEFDGILNALALSTYPEGDEILWHSGRAGSGYPVQHGYHNPQVNALFEQAKSELNFARRKTLYSRIQDLVYQDQPALFLCHSRAKWTLSKRIRGVGFSIRGPFGFFPGVREWWTPATSERSP